MTNADNNCENNEERRRQLALKLATDIDTQKRLSSTRKLKGFPALQRLVEVAKGDSGQCHQVRLFLLGLYNGQEWPLDLTGLRGLDADLQKAVFDVIELDWCGHEIHTFLEDGDELFQSWWRIETGALER